MRAELMCVCVCVCMSWEIPPQKVTYHRGQSQSYVSSVVFRILQWFSRLEEYYTKLRPQ